MDYEVGFLTSLRIKRELKILTPLILIFPYLMKTLKMIIIILLAVMLVGSMLLPLFMYL